MPSMQEIVMTDTENTQSPLRPPLANPPQPNGKSRFFGWKRFLVMGGVLTGAVAFGAGLALAAGPQAFGWRHGPQIERVQQIALHVLDSVGATSAQEAKIHDIIAATFAEVAPDPKDREAMRKQVLDLLRAPTVDRLAVEKLRADQVAKIDATSKKLVAAVLDIADQLTPEQRAKLADRADAMAQQGPMGGPWGGPHGGPMGGPWHGPRFDGRGPGDADGPGNGPNGR
jgi:Spy/CpxP family protein refolding chaperone